MLLPVCVLVRTPRFLTCLSTMRMRSRTSACEGTSEDASESSKVSANTLDRTPSKTASLNSACPSELKDYRSTVIPPPLSHLGNYPRGMFLEDWDRHVKNEAPCDSTRPYLHQRGMSCRFTRGHSYGKYISRHPAVELHGGHLKRPDERLRQV